MKNLALIIGLFIINTTTFAKDYDVIKDAEQNIALYYQHELYGIVMIFDNDTQNTLFVDFGYCTIQDSVIKDEMLSIMSSEYRVVKDTIKYVVLAEQSKNDYIVDAAKVSRKYMQVFTNDTVIKFKRIKRLPEEIENDILK